jgi:hypothetical protein
MASRQMKERLEAADKRADELLSAAAGTPNATPATDGGDGDPADLAPKNNVDWEHKYKVLEGKYKAEVPKLHSAVQEQANKITELTVQMSQRSTLEDGGAVEIDFSDAKLNPKLKEFKEEYPDVFDGVVEIVKAAKTTKTKEAAPKTTETPPEPKSKESPVWTASMYQLLDVKVPDWRDINRNPQFSAWLSEMDVYSRKTKNQLLLDAYAAGDVETVSNMFGGFKASVKVDKQEDEDEDLAPPSTTSGSVDTSRSADKSITRAYISKFYQDVALGRYKGKEKLMNEIHGKIDKALASRAVQ